MKISAFITIFLLSIQGITQLTAQTNQKLNIEEATVFLNGAELTSTAAFPLNKGENEVYFTNVAHNLNESSITVGATNGVIIESVTVQGDFLNKEKESPRAMMLKDSIELMNLQIAQTESKQKLVNEEIGIIENNRKVNGDNTGLSVAELQKLLDLVNAKMETLFNEQYKITTNLKKMNDHLVQLNRQLDIELRKNNQFSTFLVVKLLANETTNCKVKVKYIVNNAGWTPTYDVYADDIHSPLKLIYKANIHQSCGIDWDNVKLTLSTGNPTENMETPEISPDYLAFVAPTMYAFNKSKKYIIDGAAVMAPRYENRANAYRQEDGIVEEKDSIAVMDPISNYVTVDNGGVNTTFDIDLPYTIPNDGKEHLVAVKKYEVPATYRYFAVPRMDKDAFLEAQITNWQDLNLLPGNTNIFYEGTYVGQGVIDVSNVKDTFSISLGRDKKVVVKWERDSKLRTVHTIGSNVNETFAYHISIRNTRKEPINILLEDQVPVSNDKDISVEDKDYGNATLDELTGKLTWTLNINANETQTENFGYNIKYPKGKTLTGMPR